jgi:hypothetical protein
LKSVIHETEIVKSVHIATRTVQQSRRGLSFGGVDRFASTCVFFEASSSFDTDSMSEQAPATAAADLVAKSSAGVRRRVCCCSRERLERTKLILSSGRIDIYLNYRGMS